MVNGHGISLSRADCEHFEMEVIEFPEADELRTDLDSYESMWSMYDEFNSGLNDLAKEDWISFRCIEFTYNHVPKISTKSVQATFIDPSN